MLKAIKYKIIAGNQKGKTPFLKCLLAVTPSPEDLCKLYLEFSDIKYLADIRETRIEKAAREIMGGNYIGRMELAAIFGDILMGEEIERIPAIPANIIEIIQSQCPFKKGNNRICDTHLLFLMPQTVQGKPLTIMRWFELEKEHRSENKGHLMDKDFDWYKDEKFANTAIKSTQWVLMPKEMVPGSTKKNWQEQLTEIRKYPDYEVPNAVSVVSGVLLHYLKIGGKLYGDRYKIGDYHPYVRTSSQRASGDRVSVGLFGSDGLYVYYWYDVNRPDGIGVAARRKFWP